jgi:murein DD-endopeptidase MepM/ murein hydrolase activator NlpD
VALGAKVRRGQVLGLLGNSGNSDAPHLHFHITDGPSALGSEGVPFIFDTVQHRGSIASLDELLADEAWIPQAGTVVRTREMPMENAVVRFRERRPVHKDRPYVIFKSFTALPPRIASLSALLRNFAFRTKSTPTGQS